MIGVLFVRSYERGERVYMAMASRGFEGNLKVARYQTSINSQDILFIIAIILITSLVRLY